MLCCCAGRRTRPTAPAAPTAPTAPTAPLFLRKCTRPCVGSTVLQHQQALQALAPTRPPPLQHTPPAALPLSSRHRSRSLSVLCSLPRRSRHAPPSFLDSWAPPLQLALALLARAEQALLAADLGGVMLYLRDWPDKAVVGAGTAQPQPQPQPQPQSDPQIGGQPCNKPAPEPAEPAAGERGSGGGRGGGERGGWRSLMAEADALLPRVMRAMAAVPTVDSARGSGDGQGQGAG